MTSRPSPSLALAPEDADHEALAEAAVNCRACSLYARATHVKWEPRGKRRIHAKPNGTEVHACHGWLEREIALVAPEVIVCLGATAAQALLGRDFRLTKHRGVLLDRAGEGSVLATYHPSALLRMRVRDEEGYLRERDAVVRDLVTAASGIRFRPRGRRSTRATHHAAH